jgi:SPP1 family predicted phage head-tail adaptor
MTRIHTSLEETSPPGAEPVTLDAVKEHMRIDHDADDTVLLRLIEIARGICEDYTGRALISRGYSLWLDRWPSAAPSGAWWDGVRDGAEIGDTARSLALPRPPLVSVSSILQHADDDTFTTYSPDNYFTDAASLPGRIALKDAAPAPLGTRSANAIEVRFRAGYGNAPDDVPAALRQGMMQLAAHYYESRGDDPAGDAGLGRAVAVRALQDHDAMTIGMMRHRITLQKPVLTPDGGGGYTRAFADLDETPEVSAAFRTLSASEQFRQRQLSQHATHRFIIRWRGDVTADMRVIKDGAAYAITALSDPDGDKRRLVILASEV